VAEYWFGLLAASSTYATPATAAPATSSVVGGSVLTYCQADCAAPVTDERADDDDEVEAAAAAGVLVDLDAVVLAVAVLVAALAVDGVRECEGEAAAELKPDRSYTHNAAQHSLSVWRAVYRALWPPQPLTAHAQGAQTKCMQLAALRAKRTSLLTIPRPLPSNHPLTRCMCHPSHFLGSASTAPLLFDSVPGCARLGGCALVTLERGELLLEDRGESEKPSTFSLLRRDRWPRTTFCILMAASTSSGDAALERAAGLSLPGW